MHHQSGGVLREKNTGPGDVSFGWTSRGEEALSPFVTGVRVIFVFIFFFDIFVSLSEFFYFSAWGGSIVAQVGSLCPSFASYEF